VTRTLRSVLLLVGGVQILAAAAFFVRFPAAINLWPFPGTTPLTYIFVSSIFAAAGAATLWAAGSDNYGALAGIGLDYLCILVPVALLSLRLGAASGSLSMTAYGIACVLGAAFGLALLLWSVRIPLDETLAMPGGVRWAFVFFIVALLIVATRLVLKVPNAIPWMITPELSVVIGCMFYGAAAYFAYGLFRPSWANAAGQMIGFLAYDVVLIVPFLTRLPNVPPQHRVGLTIYTGVVLLSSLIAIFYLFVQPTTRAWTWRRARTV
jgi:hypothetical protein